MGDQRNYAVKVLHILMTNKNRAFTTSELMEHTGCAKRQTVYSAICALECEGFGIEVNKGPAQKGLPNTYKFKGIYGGIS